MSVDIRIVESAESKKLFLAIKELKDKGVKVGWVERQQYQGKKITVAAVAAQNEFGNPSKNIPARPFMRPTVISKRNFWRKQVEFGASQILLNNTTIDEVLNKLGQDASADVKRTITRVYYPALAESTILARIRRNAQLSKRRSRFERKHVGNITKPLIDTGEMYNTLTYQITDE